MEVVILNGLSEVKNRGILMLRITKWVSLLKIPSEAELSSSEKLISNLH